MKIFEGPVHESSDCQHVYEAEQEPRPHYFALRLQRILSPDALRHRREELSKELASRHGLLLDQLLAQGTCSYELRIIATPDTEFPSHARIAIGFIGRADVGAADKAEQHAKELSSLLRASFEAYEFEIVAADQVPTLLRPFAIRHPLAVRRLPEWVTIDSANGGCREKRAGFSSDGHYTSTGIHNGSVLEIPAFKYSPVASEALLKLLCEMRCPVAVSIRVRPTELGIDERRFLEDQIAACECAAQVGLGVAGYSEERAQRVRSASRAKYGRPRAEVEEAMMRDGTQTENCRGE